MAKASKNPVKMNVHLPDEDVASILKVVLAYESTIRGRTIGQTCSELVMEAVDADSYPPEVRARLAEIAEATKQRAVTKSLEMS